MRSKITVLFVLSFVCLLWVSVEAEAKPHHGHHPMREPSFDGQLALPRFGAGSENKSLAPGTPLFGGRFNMLGSDGPKVITPWHLIAINLPLTGFVFTHAEKEIEPKALQFQIQLFKGGSIVWTASGALPMNLVEKQPGPEQFYMYSGAGAIAVDFNNPLLLRSRESLEAVVNLETPSVNSFIALQVGWQIAPNGLSLVQATPGTITYYGGSNEAGGSGVASGELVPSYSPMFPTHKTIPGGKE
jgi:hypothetical protein